MLLRFDNKSNVFLRLEKIVDKNFAVSHLITTFAGRKNDYLCKFNIMLEFLECHHLIGLSIGVCTFLIIGMFHPLVIKAHYYLGTGCWWVFLLFGIGGVVASLLVENIFFSTLLGVFSFSSFWSIKELFEQQERVRKGWFPKNPKRKYPF